MKLYVWDNIGWDCGLYVALAPSEEAARELLTDKYDDTVPRMVAYYEPAVYDLDTPAAFEHGCCLT